MNEEIAPIRLLSPRHNRIWYSHAEDAGGVLTQKRMALATVKCLTAAGWTIYNGPAKTMNGYVEPGSDPLVVPQGPMVRGRLDRL